MAVTNDIEKIRSLLREQLPYLRSQYAVKSLGIFGSYIRGEAGEESDLDLLVRFDKTPGLLRFVELEYYLSDLLDLNVDLVIAESLKPAIQERVEEEVELL